MYKVGVERRAEANKMLGDHVRHKAMRNARIFAHQLASLPDQCPETAHWT